MYERRLPGFGPPTYSSKEFQKKILSAASLDFPHKPTRVLDLMSGPGLLGKALQEWTPQDDFCFLDLSAGLLRVIKVKDPNNPHDILVQADARRLPFKGGVFPVGIVRYAAKDLPYDQQAGLFSEMYHVTSSEGLWVLADMYVPFGEDGVQNVQIDKWLNYQHAMKQEASGRDRNREGTCHIPTEQGWLNLFISAGFQAKVVDHHMSLVTTTDWLTSNQVNAEQLEELNNTILTAPSAAIRAFNIRKEDGLVRLDYPVTIIRAKKH